MKLTEEFIQLVRDLFPIIENSNSKSIIESLKQFNIREKTSGTDTSIKEEIYLQITRAPILDHIFQGDIINDIPFHFVDKDGNLRKKNSKGMILSASCDIENDDYIIIAPCYPLTQLSFLDQAHLTTNMYFKFICLNNSSVPDNCLVVDLSMINSFSTNLINNKIKSGQLKKIYSLTLHGYYLLLLKLTVHFLRPEDKDAITFRDDSHCA